MSPLVEYLGNVSSQDNTEAINLNPAADGSPRSIARGARALVSGDELVSLAANYQIAVVENGNEPDRQSIPTKMPDGYNFNGYPEGESREALFTNDDTFDAAIPVTPAAPAAVAPTSSPAVPTPAPASPSSSDSSSSASTSSPSAS